MFKHTPLQLNAYTINFIYIYSKITTNNVEKTHTVQPRHKIYQAKVKQSHNKRKKSSKKY